MKRIVCDYGVAKNNTLIICTAGLHGNEPAGVLALELVFQHLKKYAVSVNAKFVGIIGNLKALQENKRFLEKDLNRIWTEYYLEKLNNYKDVPDIQELIAIKKLIDDLNATPYQNKIFIDLHTTSAQNGIFMVSGDFEKSKYITEHLQVPVILGLEKQLKGTLINYMKKQGFISFAFEGGQHNSRESVQNMEWMVWNTLIAVGAISENNIPDEIKSYEKYNTLNKHLPSVMQVDYRHLISEEDSFKMLEGFDNFSFVEKNQLLAQDKKGRINSPLSGYLLMPLYQEKGEEGFFIVNELL